jgi:hypothetical protein
MEKLTPEKRSEIAKKAATARWGQSKLQEQPLKVHGDPLDVPSAPAKTKKRK